MRKLIDHITGWLEGYFWLPLSLLSIWLAGLFYTFLTGRHPPEDPSWVINLSSRSVICVLVVLFAALYKQQTGVWLSKSEQFKNPTLASIERICRVLVASLFAYILLH